MSTEEKHNCPSPEELLNKTRLNIEKFGLQVIMVGSTSYLPSFVYSIGLWKTYQHPEVICFGLGKDLGHSIINDIAELIKNGTTFGTEKTYPEIFKDSRAAFLKVDPENINDYFGAGINYYQSDDFPALQLVWTDRNDVLPWEQDFEEEFRYTQPLLDRNIDFKFKEPKNLTTFTTRQWLELQKPILRVVHDDDGDWQFLTCDQMPDDIRIVALEQLVLRDKTLNEIFNLDFGEEAEREFIGGEWTRNPYEDGEDE